MARDHGRVLCKIWGNEDFRALNRTAQALYIQLISQPNINNAGVLPLMLSKWAKGCHETTSDSIVADLAALVDASFVVVDTDTEEVLVRSYIRNDGILKQPNVLKNAFRCAEAIESPILRRVLAAELRRTRRADAARVADVLDPPDPPDSEGIDKGSEPLREHIGKGSETPKSTPPENPSSNPSETLLEPGRVSEPFPEPRGEGEGEGEYLRTPDGWVGDPRAPAHVRGRTHTRGTAPPADHADAAAEPSRHCPRHPGGTPDPCGLCAAAREIHEQWYDRQARTRIAERDRERAARRACRRCDDFGWRKVPAGIADLDPPVAPCDHHTDALPAEWVALLATAHATAQEPLRA